MSIEILDCLKRERDICVKTIITSQNTASMWTPALMVISALYGYDSRSHASCNTLKDPCVTTFVMAIQCSSKLILNIPTSDSDTSRIIQVQSRPILDFVLFKRRIDESVFSFGRWIE